MKEWQVISAEDESIVYDSFEAQEDAEKCAQAIANMTAGTVLVRRIARSNQASE